MYYYRQHIMAKQLFREKIGKGSAEAYSFKTHKWEVTPEAIDAFYEGTDTRRLTAQEVKLIIESRGGKFEEELQ